MKVIPGEDFLRIKIKQLRTISDSMVSFIFWASLVFLGFVGYFLCDEQQQKVPVVLKLKNRNGIITVINFQL